MIKNIMKNIGPKKEIKTIPFNPKDLEYVEADGTKRKFTPEEMLAELNEMKAEEEKDSKDTTRIEGEIKGLKEYMETLEKSAEVKEPFLIQGMTKDKYIPWRMDAHGETKAQAESAWNHAEEQAKNKEKKPLTSPDLIPSYDDFNPLRD